MVTLALSRIQASVADGRLILTRLGPRCINNNIEQTKIGLIRSCQPSFGIAHQSTTTATVLSCSTRVISPCVVVL